nr:NADH dehydrogenase subunit 6 [Tenerus flavicollis]
MKFMIFPMISFSLMIIFLKHPLSLGIILLIQTIMTSLMIGTINFNFWFSYILFLIMIGGMLILFIYMTSIASNEKFKIAKSLILLFYVTLILTSLMMMIDSYSTNILISNIETQMINMNLNYKFSMNKMFNFPNIYLIYISLIYLLITLIAVVKISNINMGPLRQNN